VQTTGTATAQPFWQDQPCPAWCKMTAPHADSDSVEERLHMSPFHLVDLTTEDADVSRPVPGVLEVSPSFLTAQLEQHHRERDPRVLMLHGDVHMVHLTLSEATQLRDALTSLLHQADGDAS
jgi:hypothetical protein